MLASIAEAAAFNKPHRGPILRTGFDMHGARFPEDDARDDGLPQNEESPIDGAF
ncbi:MAG: hypothetical protein H6591_06565 [Flavobacteriales bacterium]|nr:hypothetical protein [Flavobacteriales bacterium]